MIDTASLKTTIAALLASHLGTYIFSNGATTPALRVDDGSDPYPEEPTVLGLEVVIESEVAVQPANLLAGDRRLDYTSRIVLKQWNVAASTRIARELLISALDVEEVAIVPRSTRLNNIETCTLTLAESLHLFKLSRNG